MIRTAQCCRERSAHAAAVNAVLGSLPLCIGRRVSVSLVHTISLSFVKTYLLLIVTSFYKTLSVYSRLAC